MKRIVVLLSVGVFCLFLTITKAQNAFWEWALSPTGNAIARSTAIDELGNVYVAGQFMDSLSFWNDTLFNELFSDIFMAKYSDDGTLVNAISYGSNAGDDAKCITVDANNNVYLAGLFFGEKIVFDTITLLNNYYSGMMGDFTADIFIAKFDDEGNIQWAKCGGGLDMDFVEGITTDSDGNIYLTGTFWSDNISFDSVNLPNSGNTDIFVIKYDGEGNVIWAKNAIGNNQDDALDIDVDDYGNVYITGGFNSDSICFDSYCLHHYSTYLDMYLVKLDNYGNTKWLKGAYGNGDWNEASCISINISNEILVSGSYKGSYSFSNYTLPESQSLDMYLARFDSSGNVIWLNSAGGNHSDTPKNLACDISGNIYLAGNYNSDSISVQNTTIYNNGSYDMFVFKYDENGNLIWSKSAGGNDMDFVEDITSCVMGNLYATGFFSSNALCFDSIVLINNYNNAMFLAKLSDPISIINREKLTPEINVYPVPAKSELIIETPVVIKSLMLSNIWGHVVLKKQIHCFGEIKIPILNFKPGIYILELETTDGNKFSHKCIID